jgi:hypothetical protein
MSDPSSTKQHEFGIKHVSFLQGVQFQTDFRKVDIVGQTLLL